MRVLHVTPHLGGGVGKGHAALRTALAGNVEQTFLLLEPPLDRRYADLIMACGGDVRIAQDLGDVARLAREADIVQFEFWNHPRLFECLARSDFPPMRTVFWSHISGLFTPVIPPGLIAGAGRFVFSTEASLSIASVDGAPHERIAVIDSGFGFPPQLPERITDGLPQLAYLGTVDFVKMNPGFFEAVDALDMDALVSVWGECSTPVVARALAMSHPQRIRFRGQTATPAAALSDAEIFFYPLQPHHYGTAENALVEAMSLGLVPVVLNNPAEAAIVQDGETGLIGETIDHCVELLRTLLTSAGLRDRLSRNAAAAVAATRTPLRSASAFMALWHSLLAEAPRRHDFTGAIGNRPADWYAATQRLPGAPWVPIFEANPPPSKGTIAHFEHVFPNDRSLARLRADAA
jgi:glycosyltransferase involved in cell wall biosynthesis